MDFDKFLAFEKSVKKFKKTLKKFDDSENSFFDAIIHRTMPYKSEWKIIDKNKIRDVLGDDFQNDLLETKGNIKLYRTILDILADVFKLTKS